MTGVSEFFCKLLSARLAEGCVIFSFEGGKERVGVVGVLCFLSDRGRFRLGGSKQRALRGAGRWWRHDSVITRTE